MVSIDHHPPRVMVIYPDGDTAQGIEDSLQAGGIPSIRCDDVYRAVSSFTSQPTQLVLIGLAHLDDRDLEVIRVLREVRPEVHVIAAFPTERRESAVRALALGADAYLLEPFYMGEMFALVKRGLLRADVPADAGPLVAGGEGIEQLAGAVAHAINNSLQIIELLLTDAGGDGPQPEDLRRETTRINEVVDELLAFSRRADEHKSAFDLNDLIEKQLPRERCEERKIELALCPGPLEILGDERGLGFALEAFLRLQRARKGTHRLVLSTVREEGPTPVIEARLSVREIHLSREERDSLFLPFSGLLGGTVGLACVTALAIVKAHEGSVRISTRKDTGTTLAIRLPAAQAAPVEGGERGNLREGA